MILSKKQTMCVYFGHEYMDGFYSTIEEMAQALSQSSCYIEANRLYIRVLNQNLRIHSVGYMDAKGNFFPIGTTDVWLIRDLYEIPSGKAEYVLEAEGFEFSLTKKEAIQLAEMLNSCLKRQCAA